MVQDFGELPWSELDRNGERERWDETLWNGCTRECEGFEADLDLDCLLRDPCPRGCIHCPVSSVCVSETREFQSILFEIGIQIQIHGRRRSRHLPDGVHRLDTLTRPLTDGSMT